jgi:hypothetical protein
MATDPEFAVFGSAAASLVLAGHPAIGGAFAVITILNSVLDRAIGRRRGPCRVAASLLPDTGVGAADSRHVRAGVGARLPDLVWPVLLSVMEEVTYVYYVFPGSRTS